MSEAAPLQAVLRRIRRRLRLWNALEGIVVGTSMGVLALAAAIAAAKLGGRTIGLGRPAALLLVSATIGALVMAARRIPLVRCARAADAALDRQDRVLSALSLGGTDSPMARALVVDAAARAATLAPGNAVPARRPRGLPVLAAGALALAVAAVVPARSRAALPPAAVPALAGPPIGADALEVERDEARAAAAAADKLGDENLRALAAEMNATLRRLASGKLGDGEALEALAALERQVAAAAAAAAREQEALRGAERALTAEAATRPAGQALSADAAQAEDRARAAMATSAEKQPSETARALAAAARAVSASAAAEAAAQDKNAGQRRLNREEEARDGTDSGRDRAQSSSNDRRLERLERNLNQSSAACRDGDPSCRSKAEGSARELAELARRAASADSLRRLERAVKQMRERLGRGEMRNGEGSALRRFQRDARGGGSERQQGSGGKQDGRGMGQGEAGEGGEEEGGSEPGEGSAMAEGEGAGTGEETLMLTEREVEERSGGASGGEGQGNEAGGKPLGQRQEARARGHESEARVASGAGPNRAEVIGSAASRGFAQRGYAGTFGEYQAAVEDALTATAVPEGRRYVVRRYFDLIRPRSGKSGQSGKSGNVESQRR